MVDDPTWDQIREGLELLDVQLHGIDNQLHTARYIHHKIVCHKYHQAASLGMPQPDGTTVKMPPQEAKEMYRMAMANFDQLILEAVNGHLREANEVCMKKGFEV